MWCVNQLAVTGVGPAEEIFGDMRDSMSETICYPHVQEPGYPRLHHLRLVSIRLNKSACFPVSAPSSAHSLDEQTRASWL